MGGRLTAAAFFAVMLGATMPTAVGFTGLIAALALGAFVSLLRRR